MTGTSIAGAPRRRPDGGGYPRGEETRARIIAAALQVFGEEGYSCAATRQIADAAGVNPPALQYYFDSKEGLHRACAQFIIDRFHQALSPAFQAANAAFDTGDASRALDAVCDTLDALVDFSLTSEDAAGWSRFMGRGQVEDAGPAFPMIHDGIVRPVHDAFSRMIGLIIDRPAAADETRLRAILVLSPLTALHANRGKTLAQLAWPDFGDGRREAVKALLRAHTRAALATPASPTPKP